MGNLLHFWANNFVAFEADGFADLRDKNGRAQAKIETRSVCFSGNVCRCMRRPEELGRTEWEAQAQARRTAGRAPTPLPTARRSARRSSLLSTAVCVWPPHPWASGRTWRSLPGYFSATRGWALVGWSVFVTCVLITTPIRGQPALTSPSLSLERRFLFRLSGCRDCAVRTRVRVARVPLNRTLRRLCGAVCLCTQANVARNPCAVRVTFPHTSQLVWVFLKVDWFSAVRSARYLMVQITGESKGKRIF